MIFATDLDSTLIYSKRYITPEINNIKLIEKKEEKEISYITEEAYNLLKELNNSYNIIPVTTRNLEEFYRIDIFKHICPKYFIVDNGGRIFINGIEDSSWQQEIKNKLENYDYHEIYDKILNVFYKIGIEIVKQKVSDNLIWVFVMKEMNDSIFKKIKERINDGDWSIEYSSNKVYIIPNFITKWNALNYLNEKYLNNDTIISAGDSILDYDMLLNSNNAIIPLHSTLTNNKFKNNVYITKNSGLLASEEILQKVKSLLI